MLRLNESHKTVIGTGADNRQDLETATIARLSHIDDITWTREMTGYIQDRYKIQKWVDDGWKLTETDRN